MGSSVGIGPYVVGEKPVPLVYQFLDSAGAPIDLTGYTATFSYVRCDGGIPATGAATVTSPTAGQVTHAWTGAEFPEPGPYWAEFWAGNTTNRFCSLRLEYLVRSAVGAVPSI